MISESNLSVQVTISEQGSRRPVIHLDAHGRFVCVLCGSIIQLFLHFKPRRKFEYRIPPRKLICAWIV